MDSNRDGILLKRGLIHRIFPGVCKRRNGRGRIDQEGVRQQKRPAQKPVQTAVKPGIAATQDPLETSFSSVLVTFLIAATKCLTKAA